MTNRVNMEHAVDVENAFQSAMALAEADGGDDNGGVKWAICCAVNRLRDDGHDAEASIAILRQCVDDVLTVIEHLDKTPGSIH